MIVILIATAAIVFASVVVCLGGFVNFVRESRREARLDAELDAEWERHLASVPTDTPIAAEAWRALQRRAEAVLDAEVPK